MVELLVLCARVCFTFTVQKCVAPPQSLGHRKLKKKVACELGDCIRIRKRIRKRIHKRIRVQAQRQ